MSGKDKTFKLLFIGDIVARPGREAIKALLPNLKKELNIDVVIANVENLAGGKGITNNTLYEMISSGVDLFTGGNHIFSQEESAELLDDLSLNIVRPVNYPGNIPGRGALVYENKGKRVLLINLEGQAAMGNCVDNPFFRIDEVLGELSQQADIIIVDFHAELTSEKRAMGFYLDGRVSAVFGTHTHVATADLQILPDGTLYVSDVGMTGNVNSVLGVKADIIIDRFKYPRPKRFIWEYEGEKVFNGILCGINEKQQVVEFRRIEQLIP